PPGDERADGAEGFIQHLRTLSRDVERHRAARYCVLGVAALVPVKELHAVLAERVLRPVVRPRDVTVQRHRQPADYLAHVASPIPLAGTTAPAQTSPTAS